MMTCLLQPLGVRSLKSHGRWPQHLKTMKILPISGITHINNTKHHLNLTKLRSFVKVISF